MDIRRTELPALRRPLAAFALALVGALAPGGCDSGSTPSPPPTPTTPAPAPPPPAPAPPPCAAACPTGGEPLDFGFFFDFAPLSYSADRTPGSAGFDTHRGYEAALVTALEALDGADLAFSRRGIGVWPDIWLRPAAGEFDIVGGGITILEDRTRDASGAVVIAFTSGHFAVRQSLLVRAADASRIATHDDLTSDIRVAVLSGTTGEARLLQLSGLADGDGVLAAGARIATPAGEVVADGTAAFVIRASGATPNLAGRQRLLPPSDDLPQVVFFPADATVEEMVASIAAGVTDALARAEIPNLEVAAASGGTLTVTALDSEAEYGGFALDADDGELLACVDEKLDYLTDDRRLGYAEWSANPEVFRERAAAWVCGAS